MCAPTQSLTVLWRIHILSYYGFTAGSNTNTRLSTFHIITHSTLEHALSHLSRGPFSLKPLH